MIVVTFFYIVVNFFIAIVVRIDSTILTEFNALDKLIKSLHIFNKIENF